MFKEERYDKQVRIFPHKGMNQDIAALLLKPEHAFYLNNILPFPKGEGMVRYGTRLIYDGKTLPAHAEIISLFPSYGANGSKQILLYVRDFIFDSEATNLVVLDAVTLGVTTPKKDFYDKDYKIRIEYSIPDEGTFEEEIVIKAVVKNQENNQVVITTSDFIFAENTTINKVWYPLGRIYLYDAATKVLTLLRSDLHPHCLSQGITFKGHLFICNGVNKVMRWNGQEIVDVKGFVEETALDITKTGTKILTFKASISFKIENYQNNTVRVVSTKGGSIESLVTNIQNNMGVITLTIADNLPDFDKNGAKLSYLKDVPRFSWMRVLHDRIFALGQGISGINYRSPSEAMKVYFQYESNSLTGWFSPVAKSMPSIDLSDKHGIPDNLEAISFVNGYTVFLGRKKVQVWSGTEPAGGAGAEGKPVLQYFTSLNVGLMHRNLMAELPNETVIANENGLFSLGTYNIARQFSATPIPQVNQIVKNNSSESFASKEGWDSTISCFYPQGNFFFFRFGQREGIAAVIEGTISSFAVFSGDFEYCQSFLDSLDNSLYLAIDNQIFQYADENSGVPLYGDSGGERLISFSWTLSPFTGKRWSNKYIQLFAEYPSSFLLKKDNTLSISVSGDIRKSFTLDASYDLPMKGDIIESVPMLEFSRYDDNDPLESEEGERMDYPYLMPVKRLRFPASTFFISIRGYTNSGKINIRKIALFGRWGRRG